MNDDTVGYARGLLRAAVLTAAAAVGFWLATPADWQSFYLWASVLLIAVALFTPVLVRQLKRNGRSRAWALAFAVPAALIGIVQIAFWIVFFRIGPTNPVPGVVRQTVLALIGDLLPAAALGLCLAWIALFAWAGVKKSANSTYR